MPQHSGGCQDSALSIAAMQEEGVNVIFFFFNLDSVSLL